MTNLSANKPTQIATSKTYKYSVLVVILRTVKSRSQSVAVVFGDGYRTHYQPIVIEEQLNVPQQTIPQNNGMGKDTLQLIEEPRLLLDTNFLADVLQ